MRSNFSDSLAQPDPPLAGPGHRWVNHTTPSQFARWPKPVIMTGIIIPKHLFLSHLRGA